MVVDIESQQVYSTDLTPLSSDLQEQLQSTNMQFYQDRNTLFIIGDMGVPQVLATILLILF
ncbi:MAG: hypothetical protein ACI9O4_000524 [Chitinophagales bacterium]|jgi:hypothetical protein